MIQIVENQILTCPMAGWADSVKHSPDTYIAAGLLGAGVVLFPHEGVLRAPCCGVVTFLRPEKYALGIQGQQGMEILFESHGAEMCFQLGCHGAQCPAVSDSVPENRGNSGRRTAVERNGIRDKCCFERNTDRIEQERSHGK